MPYRPPSGNGWPTEAGFNRHNRGTVGRWVSATRRAAGGAADCNPVARRADGARPGNSSPESLPQGQTMIAGSAPEPAVAPYYPPPV